MHGFFVLMNLLLEGRSIVPQRVCVRACVKAGVGMEDLAFNYKPIVTTLSRLTVRCNVLLSIKELVFVKYKSV